VYGITVRFHIVLLLGEDNVYGAFASKFGSGLAKVGKKVAQSEAGRSATRAAIKGATNAAADDLSNRYLGGKEVAQPPPPENETKHKKKSENKSSHKEEPQMYSTDDDGSSDEFEEHHQVRTSEKSRPPPSKASLPSKPSVLNRFKPSINTKTKSKHSSPQQQRTNQQQRNAPAKEKYRYSAANKKPDWDVLPRAVALYNYRAQMKCDLEFRKGQMIQVMTRTDDQFDWWEGKIDDKIGIFPANYVKMMS
jgi:hypothetical protein